MHALTGHRRAHLALLAAITLWGSTFIITKQTMDEIGPFALTFLRFLIGFLVLWPIAGRQGFRPAMIVQPVFLQFGLTGVALFYGLQNLGLLYTSASATALIEAGIPAITALFSFLLLRERITPPRLAGIAVTLAGVALVTGTKSADAGTQALLGNLLVFGAALSFAIYTIQGKKLAADYPPAVSTAASFGAGLIFLTPTLVGELYLNGMPHVSAGGWLAILYLGIGTSALTLFLWNYALQYVETSAAALYTSLAPVTGIGFALLLGESTTPVQLAGGALAIAGVWVGNWTATRSTAQPEHVERNE